MLAFSLTFGLAFQDAQAGILYSSSRLSSAARARLPRIRNYRVRKSTAGYASYNPTRGGSSIGSFSSELKLAKAYDKYEVNYYRWEQKTERLRVRAEKKKERAEKRLERKQEMERKQMAKKAAASGQKQPGIKDDGKTDAGTLAKDKGADVKIAGKGEGTPNTKKKSFWARLWQIVVGK